MEELQNILYAVITAAVPIITGFVCKWLASLYENNKIRIKNERANVILGQVTDMIIAAVETTTSTYVKELKANNLFTKELHKEAFKKTFDTVKKQLTEESTEIITAIYGDIDEYLTNKIEQFVEELKD